jgi:hypothetical protein
MLTKEWVSFNSMTPDRIKSSMEIGDEKERKVALQSISHHYLHNVFDRLDCGANNSKIHVATPADKTLAIKLGWHKYAIKAFFKLIPPRYISQIDDLIGVVSMFTRHQSLHGFPPTNFPCGVSNLSKLTADECSGVLFILVLVLSCDITYSNDLKYNVGMVDGMKNKFI